MVQVNYSVQINPRFEREIIRGHGTATVKASKTFLVQGIRLTKKLMKEEAPRRTGRLIRGIKELERKTTKTGQFDRRANIVVASTAPHSVFVVGGVLPSKGRYVGPGSTSYNYKGTGKTVTFRASRNYTGNGKKFRATDYQGNLVGRHPGFGPNDFITRAANKVQAEIDKNADTYLGVRSYTESYNRLRRLFG